MKCERFSDDIKRFLHGAQRGAGLRSIRLDYTKSNSKIEKIKAIRAANYQDVCTKIGKETCHLLSQELNDETTSRLEVISLLLDTKQKTLSDIRAKITSLCQLIEIGKEIEGQQYIRIKTLQQSTNSII